MLLGILKESGDQRVAIVPAVAKKMIKAGHAVMVEAGAGVKASFSDESYAEAGAQVVDRDTLKAQANLLVAVNGLPQEELSELKEGQAIVAVFHTRANPTLVEWAKSTNLRAFSLDLIPRTSIAQSMDILSSMASLAGYKAVLVAADTMPGYFPMLMTAAGTIPPAKVLILGAGVAGLQAIATARRLGAVVEAFDVRSAVKQEVESLGAKFVEVEGAQESQAAGGYAVEQTEDYKRKQGELIQAHAIKSDVVITTANIPGREAPKLIEAATVEQMRDGSVIVDLAAGTGGNCVLTEAGQNVEKHGVHLIGKTDFPSEMARDASILFGNNVWNYLQHIMPEGLESLDFSNSITAATYLGQVPEVAAAE
ncbi:NAD(P) transhydrogenase subunit alpha [Pontibacter sp. G13]|uniref:NAD(P) transhydrogenase subunit alpha n=1 Tax=Pontibacter sp. G13 TaxID=3074898 RepID=UPI00288A65FB|nr:NAD(P) transhydrogenase subunit alpha [Pontibacter sp. G13]WNJ21281.1 NAD(P) transhydrogenase subunit alpha [Pontibacter sp. G13]